MYSNERFAAVAGHLLANSCASGSSASAGASRMSCFEDEIGIFPDEESASPTTNADRLKWNGWGYADSGFFVNERGVVEFAGTRYPMGGQEFPHFADWLALKFGVHLGERRAADSFLRELPESRAPPALIQGLHRLGVECSTEGADRLASSHGQSLREVYALRRGGEPVRTPDAVAWPNGHAQAQAVVRLAEAAGAVVVPYGGGTGVADGMRVPAEERRPVLVLDTSRMRRLLRLDTENLTARFEAGARGQDVERALRASGYTCGHEPDSYEFSTVGGWVATRSAGTKRSAYGDIDRLAVGVRMATARGELGPAGEWPRVSAGPDFRHLALGSEGTLGVVTEAVLKIRPLPRSRRYGSIVFPDFETGLRWARALARCRRTPASVRLADEEQFQVGLALQPRAGPLATLWEGAKKAYLTVAKGFRADRFCVATLLFEGEPADVAGRERTAYALAAAAGGVAAGEAYGERGYALTLVVAYLRDFLFDLGVVGESFETSVPWDRALALCRGVKTRVARECRALGAERHVVSCRVTQLYDAGCCVYFYVGFNAARVADPVGACELVVGRARDEIVARGGSLSHHHGVGKARAKWYPAQVSLVGVGIYDAIKRHLDPNNVFANGNIHRTAYDEKTIANTCANL